jgi:hypothetical protein
MILTISVIYFWKHLVVLQPSWEIYCIICICAIAYYFGIKNYILNNTPTAYAVWIAFSFVACNEAADIILSPTSHSNEIFMSIFGVVAATFTATILIDNLKISEGSLKGLWKQSSNDDKMIIYVLIIKILFLGLMQYFPLGDNKFFELSMVTVTFSIDILAYIAIKNSLKTSPESESFRFWFLLWVGISIFSLYQIYNIYSIDNFFSIGLFVYLENIIFFGAVSRIILKIKFPEHKLGRILA